jgi:hypothetical protein
VACPLTGILLFRRISPAYFRFVLGRCQICTSHISSRAKCNAVEGSQDLLEAHAVSSKRLNEGVWLQWNHGVQDCPTEFRSSIRPSAVPALYEGGDKDLLGLVTGASHFVPSGWQSNFHHSTQVPANRWMPVSLSADALIVQAQPRRGPVTFTRTRRSYGIMDAPSLVAGASGSLLPKLELSGSAGYLSPGWRPPSETGRQMTLQVCSGCAIICMRIP